MTNTLAPLAQLHLPVLPAPYVWNIRPHQGDGEWQFFPAGSVFLVTLDRGFWFFGRESIRATGAPGFFIDAASTNEQIEATAAKIYEQWEAYRTRQARTRELEQLRRQRRG